MNSINISKNITDLRKTAGVTQEQLATALNVSSQAVSKWETNTCQPDTMTLPLIADYFHVSVDYLFYGKDYTYDDIYDKIRTKVSSFPQMSKDSYEEALKIFASAHHGISHGNLRGKELMYDEPTHITDENGVSLLSGKGYGAIITRRFFEDITPETAVFSSVIFGALSDKSALLTAMAIISMSDIMLNQAYSDRAKLSKLLNISDEQMSYVTNADAGCGLIKYGSALVPFINRFPRDTKLYQLMTTKPGEGVFGGNTSN